MLHFFFVNGGHEYLKKNSAVVFEKLKKWTSIMGVTDQQIEAAKKSLSSNYFDKETARIIHNDAVRTYSTEEYQSRLKKFIMSLRGHFGDYAQAMSYVGALLLLSLSEEQTFAIMSTINKDEGYIPGHWQHEAFGYARDAYVMYHFLEKEMKEVADHLQAHLIRPSMFLQKYYQGLCIHILPLEAALQYIEEFLRHGIVFLWHFSLTLFKWIKEPLLGLKDVARILALLRLEPKELDQLGLSRSTESYLKLIEEASKMTLLGDLKSYSFDLPKLRDETFNTHIKPLQAKPQTNQEEEDEEDDDCQICKDNLPDFWCEECVTFLCEDCHENGSHDNGHEVTSTDEIEEEEIDDNWKRVRDKKNVDALVSAVENLEIG
mmetsp:Transcript_15015/g.21019  ORF Transcript_15015/g.21019 Transcript_15015/m.21019 type:complete len:376 (-) Transcript_15015:59-1186(-)